MRENSGVEETGNYPEDLRISGEVVVGSWERPAVVGTVQPS